MKMRLALLLPHLTLLFVCGCASSSNKSQATKRIFERPWIGGAFERVSTPPSVRTNSQHFAGDGLIVTRVRENTPLAKAGVQEGDLLLTLNGKNIRFEQDLQKTTDHAGTAPLTAQIYRAGEILEKTITPGLERFQKIHNIIFAIGISSHLEFDLFPNPDFSLVAIGYDTKFKRLDLNDATVKYRKEQGEYLTANKDGWQGIQSEEGWKAWFGPLALSENKMIISQDPAK